VVGRTKGQNVERRADGSIPAGSPRSDTKGLDKDLEHIKQIVGLGHEVKVKWQPNAVKFRNGKQLEEEVIGDTIIIYTGDHNRARELLIHGFAEWLLNQHAKRYRMLINKLIELFEEVHYYEKERIVEALTRLILKAME